MTTNTTPDARTTTNPAQVLLYEDNAGGLHLLRTRDNLYYSGVELVEDPSTPDGDAEALATDDDLDHWSLDHSTGEPTGEVVAEYRIGSGWDFADGVTWDDLGRAAQDYLSHLAPDDEE